MQIQPLEVSLVQKKATAMFPIARMCMLHQNKFIKSCNSHSDAPEHDGPFRYAEAVSSISVWSRMSVGACRNRVRREIFELVRRCRLRPLGSLGLCPLGVV